MSWSAIVSLRGFPLLSRNWKLGGGWIRLGLFILLAQIVTIPLALWIKFKSAYISAYVLGFYYGRRFRDGGQFSGNRLASGTVSEKKLIDALFIVAALAGLLVRIALEIHPLKGGPFEAISDLLTQYGHVFQGSAFFIVVTNLSVWRVQFSPLFRKRLSWLAGITYPVYLEHEFFTKDIFTDFFAVAPYLQAVISFIAIALSALLFQKILNWTRKL